jgi:asparagine synthase (glutamine-hydrolysing)
MCGIAGIFDTSGHGIDRLDARLRHMNVCQQHRGPDGEGIWSSSDRQVGFAHTRLSIVDLAGGAQPMGDSAAQLTIVFNGEIYNFRELRAELESRYTFTTHSDTEVILHAYRAWGAECVQRLRGMFAFAIWDERRRELFLARDRFGIKPLYTAWVGKRFYFASEIKAILPFLPAAEIDYCGLRDYLTFQFCLQGKTLIQGVSELPPATTCAVGRSDSQSRSKPRHHVYWQVDYTPDLDHTEPWFHNRCWELVEDSVRAHLVADVPLGSYLSGGIDSSALAALACRLTREREFMGFHGRFDDGPAYDESPYARDLARQEGIVLRETTIRSRDFIDVFDKVIYHLDSPVAGPGSFPQYMVAQSVQGHRKVVLGGQGGDEIFGGYVRYLIAMLGQDLKGSIQGPGLGVAQIPKLNALRGYEPLVSHFFADGMFDDFDKRYFRLVDRSGSLENEIHWENFPDYDPYESYREVFFENPVGRQSSFNSMLHFDFVTLLPALLQVEDRMNMAHGVESRTPFLDHPLVEFAATIPVDIKFERGELKRLPKQIFRDLLPPSIINRSDKMGFPVPLVSWLQKELKPMALELLSSPSPSAREFLDQRQVTKTLADETQFGRKVWGLLCLESFCRQFIDAHVPFEEHFETTRAHRICPN